ncbi:ABC transporter ATP-binding protein [Rhizobium sp. NFR07]|uniref:dipeptide ABC transporter ATP-binding protein n=1 Tax=Rhizobium sp. NFR07 TaxID=1566262 RepID=UPI001FCD7C8B|nr:ABC transporter ATP-binding protein [Rhizobium sp. NFR07]
MEGFSLEHRSVFGPVSILTDVNFSLGYGEVLGVIGESGAGKSTIGNAILGLLAPQFVRVSGTIRLEGAPIDDRTLERDIRGHRIAAIFQDHTASLDPLMPVGKQIRETVLALDPALTVSEAKEVSLQLMTRVGISDAARRYADYPHQFSGGQRQRLVIAIALAGSPDVIIADEPTSALDATVQKQILALLRSLVDESGLSVILVTHDMGVVAEITDRVLVMRKGEVVEQGRTAAILDRPQHVYTQSLLAAVPRLRQTMAARKVRSTSPQWSDGRSETPILSVRNLSRSFATTGPKYWPWGETAVTEKPFALRDVSFDLLRGSVTGIVGESGSGKTTIGRIMAGLEFASQGCVAIDGREFDVTRPGRRSGILGLVQMIFQDPSLSLNPHMTIERILRESIRYGAGDVERPSDCAAMMERLGLPRSLLSRHPHQLSGGQKQRVSIARALLARPRIVVADEPTSALDVSVQAEIVALLKEAIAETDMTMVFISHDLALVQDLCDQIHIFKAGRIEDAGSPHYIFSQSTHPYTRELIAARSSWFTR